jgi:AAHS family 4-hydroxybenzoate transporter-like MFS transporter
MATFDTINVTELINTRPISRYQWSVFLLCALAALMDGYDSVVIGITAPAIAASLSLDIKSMGPIFSAAQVGFMLGAFISGPLADRLGRKQILVASVVTFGLFSLLTPLSTSYGNLVVLRFITGLGLGGASTAFVSLCAEYAPARTRATVLTILWTLVPAGNVVGGLLASVILPSHGWALVYYVGGVVPLLIAAIMIVWVPESMSFFVARGADARRIAAILSRIAPDLNVRASTTYTVSDERLPNASVKHLFGEGRSLMTTFVWISFFCCWLVLITVLAWTVPVLREAGLPISLASLMISANSGGAVLGAPLIGWLMDRTDRFNVIIVGLFAGAFAVGALGFAAGSTASLAVCFFFAGALVGGTSAGMVALVATLYPTAIRSTSIGWAIGVARLGAVVGPTLAGVMLAAGWGLEPFFIAFGVLVLISTLSIVALKLVVRRLPAPLAMAGSAA